MKRISWESIFPGIFVERDLSYRCVVLCLMLLQVQDTDEGLVFRI